MTTMNYIVEFPENCVGSFEVGVETFDSDGNSNGIVGTGVTMSKVQETLPEAYILRVDATSRGAGILYYFMYMETPKFNSWNGDVVPMPSFGSGLGYSDGMRNLGRLQVWDDPCSLSTINTINCIALGSTPQQSHPNGTSVWALSSAGIDGIAYQHFPACIEYYNPNAEGSDGTPSTSIPELNNSWSYEGVWEAEFGTITDTVPFTDWTGGVHFSRQFSSGRAGHGGCKWASLTNPDPSSIIMTDGMKSILPSAHHNKLFFCMET